MTVQDRCQDGRRGPSRASRSVTILLAHQHPVVRLGVRAILKARQDYLVLAETGDGSEVARLVERLRPNVLLIDVNMPGFGGVDMIQRTLLCSSGTRVVVLATSSDENYAATVLRKGAAAFVAKGVSATVLLEALRETTAGWSYVNPQVSERVVFQQAHHALVCTYATLTAREREVLYLSAQGHTAGSIAKRLSVSRRTVEKHRANLSGKLGIHTPADLLRYALRRGIGEAPLQTAINGECQSWCGHPSCRELSTQSAVQGAA
jgi:DNA-binding NarL/FixJ family response regulator